MTCKRADVLPPDSASIDGGRFKIQIARKRDPSVKKSERSDLHGVIEGWGALLSRSARFFMEELTHDFNQRALIGREYWTPAGPRSFATGYLSRLEETISWLELLWCRVKIKARLRHWPPSNVTQEMGSRYTVCAQQKIRRGRLPRWWATKKMAHLHNCALMHYWCNVSIRGLISPI